MSDDSLLLIKEIGDCKIYKRLRIKPGMQRYVVRPGSGCAISFPNLRKAERYAVCQIQTR